MLQNYFRKTLKSAFLLSLDNGTINLASKLGLVKTKLGEICTVNQGLRTGDNDLYLSPTKTLPSPKPAVGGRNIAKYIAKSEFFVQYETEKLDAPRNEAIFISPQKIIVQEI